MTSESILEPKGGSVIQSHRETCRHRPRQQIGTVTLGRREVGILGILHGREICCKFRTRFGCCEINFPTIDGGEGRVCEQNTHSHSMHRSAQCVTTSHCTVWSLFITRTRVAQGSNGSSLGVLRIVCHPRVMSRSLAAPDTDHQHMFSVTYLSNFTVVLSLTLKPVDSRSIHTLRRFTAEWRSLGNPISHNKRLFESTFQQSSTRFSCMTSRSVKVDLVPSMYFSGKKECFFFRHIGLNRSALDPRVFAWWKVTIYTFFLQHIQICEGGPCHINVFRWNRECFFFRHVELTSRFIVMSIDEVTSDRPEGTGFSFIF